MKETDVRNAAGLDAVLAARAMAKHERLWKAAEGRTVRWSDVIAAIVGGLLALTGLYGAFVNDELVGAYQLAFGLAVMGFATLRHQQAQIEALRELVRLQEVERRQQALER